MGVEDWETHQEDAVLRFLWGYRQLAGAGSGVRVPELARPLGLSAADAAVLVQRMVHQGRLIPGRTKGTFRLSLRGVHEVDRLLRKHRPY